jgi:hypothetical protein
LKSSLKDIKVHATHEPSTLTVTRQTRQYKLFGSHVSVEEAEPIIILPLQAVDSLSDVFNAYFGIDHETDAEIALTLSTNLMLNTGFLIVAIEGMSVESRKQLFAHSETSPNSGIPANLQEEVLNRQVATDIALKLLRTRMEQVGIVDEIYGDITEYFFNSLPKIAYELYRKHGDITFLAMAVGKQEP